MTLRFRLKPTRIPGVRNNTVPPVFGSETPPSSLFVRCRTLASANRPAWGKLLMSPVNRYARATPPSMRSPSLNPPCSVRKVYCALASTVKRLVRKRENASPSMPSKDPDPAVADGSSGVPLESDTMWRPVGNLTPPKTANCPKGPR